jgi:hypothetical protein
MLVRNQTFPHPGSMNNHPTAQFSKINLEEFKEDPTQSIGYNQTQ